MAWDVASQLRSVVPDARWVPRDNYHVTMLFLGHVPDERVPALSSAAASAASSMVAFDVRVGALGAFPSPRRARVVWLGLEDPAGGFSALAEACAEAYAPHGFAAERRPFVPHLTLARLKAPARVALDAAVPSAVRFTVDRLTLFRSVLGRPAARYEALAVYPFGLGA